MSGETGLEGRNRLQQDEQFTYEYDANGNLITQTEIATGGLTNYVWDAQDQLIGINKVLSAQTDLEARIPLL